MISFKEYLTESAHRQILQVHEAVKMIEEHCKDALRSRTQIYRGMNPGEDAYLLHGEASTRKSANTTNYYTVILDHFLPPLGYPKRSESIIATNDYETASGFGAIYAVFPFDGVKIGVCSKSDLWYSPPIEIGGQGKRIDRWNKIWQEYGLSAESYEAFVSSIKEKMGADGGAVGRELTAMFGGPDGIEPALKKAYSPEVLELGIATTKTISDFANERELWIGGKCVAIRANVWHNIQAGKQE